RDLVAGDDAVLAPAEADIEYRSAEFETEFDHFTVVSGNEHLHPRMRVGPLQFLDAAGHRIRHGVVELDDGMMGLHMRNVAGLQQDRCDQQASCFHCFPRSAPRQARGTQGCSGIRLEHFTRVPTNSSWLWFILVAVMGLVPPE